MSTVAPAGTAPITPEPATEAVAPSEVPGKGGPEDRRWTGRRLAWALVGYQPVRYAVGGSLWIAMYAMPLVYGLLVKAIFDRLADGQPADLDAALWLVGALVASEAVRGGLFYTALQVWMYWWNASLTLLRSNILRSVLCSRGPAASRLPSSTGEAVGRLRDDSDDLVILTDQYIDLAGTAVFAAGALAIMAAIDPVVTLVLVLPLGAAMIATRALGDVIQRTHRAERQAGANVTGLVGELFGGALALKCAGAEDAALARFRERNATRRDSAVRSRLVMDVLDTVTASTVELSFGLVLLIAAPRLGSGEFTVGDLGLFITYAGWLASFPRMVGRVLWRQQHATIAGERLTRLMSEDETSADLVEYAPVWFRTPAPPAPIPSAMPGDRLAILEVEGLTALHPDSDRGVVDADVRIERGSFTVVTGAVGAGKTTLLRAVLGLLPAEAGEIRWNGIPVDDPGSNLVPPRVAYAAQVPRLFSASLHENLVLGLPDDERLIADALHLAALDDDVAAMVDGLETMVGPRGVRLSGGQVQRATAARALVRQPELLVVDDLSSALDVETEERLWSRLAGGGPATCLVVSHRRAALARADQVVVLDGGRVVGRGPLAELLDTCPEMRRLWAEESVIEAEEALV
jgi:ATP-binding cassette subfamily B protein